MTNSEAMQAFSTFVYNYNHNFIQECWVDNDHMMGHLLEKFKDKYATYGATHGFMSWHRELDAGNLELLHQYIIDKYKTL